MTHTVHYRDGSEPFTIPCTGDSCPLHGRQTADDIREMFDRELDAIRERHAADVARESED